MSIGKQRVCSNGIFKPRNALFFLGFLVVFAQLGRAADALNYFKNYFVTGDYAVGGVGLRGTGVNGYATGTINFTGVPAGADIVAAFLYWETEESTAAASSTNGFFDGNAIVGKNLGNSMNPSCLGANGAAGPANTSGRVYRADILRYLPIDSTNSIRLPNGWHTVKLIDSGVSGTAPNTNGASMVVIYRVLTLGTPLKAVVIYDGAYTMAKNTAAMTQTIAGFYQASPNRGASKMAQIVANGQSTSSETITVNGVSIGGRASPFIGTAGVRWDNPTFSISLSQNASSYTTQVTSTNSCLTWNAIVTSVYVTDTDGDGLLDVWETKGLHLNDQVSPATFGGCSDYPSDPCVNLPAMGANPNVQDIFAQIDWLQGTDGHLHAPKLAALSAIAATFANHSIQLHFDVGNNYQQPPASYIVPAAYAQGGQVIEESTLLCPNAQTSVCAFPNLPYSVQSWKIGLRAVEYGFPLLGIPAHFAENRKDIFHYVLFGHALAIPYSPPTGLPKSTSGVADRPGGDVLVTLGLWRSDVAGDDQVGSEQVQAGTLMHELGHNLGLSHAGIYRVPNCMPNYQSVMNYLYQSRGLTDAAGLEHIDYSYGVLPDLNENSLTATSLGSTTTYRVRYFGPVNPSSPATAATFHCDGTPITNGAQEVRLESPIGPIDWMNNGFASPGPFPFDINFNGYTGDPVQDSVTPTATRNKLWFADSDDWANLNLPQIGARLNAGGLSADVGQADLGQADLGQADLGQADLGQADLGQADLGQADLGQADLGQADLGDVDYNTTISTIDPTSSSQPLAETGSLTGTTLTWGAPSLGQIRHYNIYRSDPANPTPALIAHVDGAPPLTTYTDAVNQTQSAGPAPANSSPSSTFYNTNYTYYITSVDINGTQSGPSNTVSNIVLHLFIAANNKTRVYGNANPAFDYVTTGQNPGLSGTTTCATVATQTSNVGNWAITCSGLTPVAGVSYPPGTLTITQAPLTFTAVTNTKTYDGTTSAAATPLMTALKNQDTVTGLAETYDTKNVGTGKTLSVTAYTINDGNGGGNYAVTTVTNSTGVIIKANPTLVVTPYNLTYDGTPHTAAGSATGVQGEALSGLDLSHTVHTNAGTYSADYWSFTDTTGNYNNVAVTTITDTINKANPTIVVTPYNLTYDGNPHTAAGTATGVGNTSLSGLALSTTHTNAGTYSTDSWSFTDTTGNYNNVATTTITDIINKANPVIVVTPYSVTYDATAHTATGTATGVGGANLNASLSLSGTTHTNAGSFTDSWTFTDTTGNYNNATSTVNDVIAKANATVNVTGYSVTYDSNPHTATGTATGVGGVNLSASLSLSGTIHTNAGTYTDSWTFTDTTGNYNNANNTVNDAIAKANATINVTPYSVTYDGNSHTATGTATGVINENLSGLVLSGTTHTNAGNYNGDPWTFSNANYNNASGAVNDAIAKANATIVVTPYTVTYDGNPHTATGTATGVGGANLIASLNLSGTTHATAGTYTTDSWSFTDTTGNYNNVATTTITDIINKANAAITVTPYTVTYDGNPHTATGTATGVGGANLIASLNLSGTTHTTAGTYTTDSWSFTDATGNYNNVATTTITDTINKATPVISWSTPSTIVYGTPLTATQLNATTPIAGGFVYTPPLTTVLNAGSNQLHTDFTPMDMLDYNGANANVFISVSPAAQSITFGALPDQAFGTPDFTVSASASSGLPVTFAASGNCTVTTGGTVDLTSAGSCTITAQQGGGGNYLPAPNVSQSFTITDQFTISDFTTLSLVGSPSAITSQLTMTSATGQTSAAWFPIKQTVGNGFTTQFQFQISSTGGQIADGFAFVIQNGAGGTSAVGTTGMGGYLGYEGLPNSLAIEFDTYQNGWDPNANHVAIQSNYTLANTANHENASLAVVNSGITTNLSDGMAHLVKVTYDGSSTLLVFLDGTQVLSAPVDLSNLGLDQGGNAVVGFTAATGDASELTNILSWTFSAN